MGAEPEELELFEVCELTFRKLQEEQIKIKNKKNPSLTTLKDFWDLIADFDLYCQPEEVREIQDPKRFKNMFT